MKKQHLYLCFLASMLGMMTTGCSDETTQTAPPTAPDEDGRITVTASAGMPQGGASTRLNFNEKEDVKTLEITWRELTSGTAETFSVVKGTTEGTTGSTPTTFTLEELNAKDKHYGTFTGEITPDGNATYYAVYPALSSSATTLDPMAVSLDVTEQAGTTSAADLQEGRTTMYSSSQYKDGNLNFQFQHLTSVLKLTLKFPATIGAGSSDLNNGGEIGSGGITGGSSSDDTAGGSSATTQTVSDIKLVAEGMPTQTTANITGESATYGTPTTSGKLTLSGNFSLSGTTELSTTVYVHILPGMWKGLKVSAKVGEKTYVREITTQNLEIKRGMMYRTTAEMEEQTFTVNATLPESSTYDYNGLEMQIGTYSTENSAKQVSLGNATITNDKAIFSCDLSEYVDKTIWVCIPKVVKFFHTLTAEELSQKELTLPDKDEGSTLKATPTAGDKKYENDWIVALYIGINKNGAEDSDTGDGAIPIYWATGNLIAIKTNDANSGTTQAKFHISTTEEYQNNTAITLPKEIKESDTDGYSQCAIGSMWDKFGWGDKTGLMTTTDYTKYAPDITGDNATASNPVWKSISGDSNYDIARKNLGDSWRLPGGGNESNSGQGEFRTFIENSKFDNTNGNYRYTFTAANNKSITNTIWLPLAGNRSKGVESIESGTGHYWSGVAKIPDDGNNNNTWRARAIHFTPVEKMKATAFTRKSGYAIRPVTE